MKPSNDSEAMRLILDGLTEKGITITDTWDGEEQEFPTNVEETLKILNNLDECVVNLRLPDGKHTFVYFVMGNDPEEVACDHGVSLSEFIDPITDPWWN
jgi:hypothetical protein